MTMRRIWFALIPFVLLYPLGAIAGEKEPSFESVAYSGFRTIEKFVSVTATVKGSAEKLGLKADDLTDFLRLRFKNSFAGMKIEAPSKPRILWDAGMAVKFGAIHLDVWTVGDDYPVAFYIAINAGNLSNSREYESAFLGYCSKSDVTKIREAISELIDDLAIAFFKARGSM